MAGQPALSTSKSWQTPCNIRRCQHISVMPIKDNCMRETITLRLATFKDADLLLEWRNDQETRIASHNMAEVPKDEHIAWLNKTLRNSSRRPEPANQSVYEKSIRLPQLRSAANLSVSYTWRSTRTAVHPQILLKSHFLVAILLKTGHPFDFSIDACGPRSFSR